MKKPKLTVIDSASAISSSTPATLGKTGAALWSAIMAEYRIDDSAGREMLLQICTANDRADEYAQIINTDGPVINGKQGLKEHPLVKHELAARSFVVRTLHKLGLDIEPTRSTVGRPPGTYVRTR
jgi:hypothetical protein